MEKLPFEKIKRKLLIKKQSETNSKYGKGPEQRTTEELINCGILNLNKPQGPTSHNTTDYIKKILNTKRAGHGGTLDPNVSGVLPIALDRATRITQFLLTAGKEYIALMHLHKPISQSKIQKEIKKFTGKIKQIPPLKSSVKRVEREREIYYIKILEIEKQDVLFKVGCQAGTYIRKLCWQMGKDLGTNAHMQQLIRSKVAAFNDKNWHSLHDLKDSYEFYKQGNDKELRKIILPIESAIQHLPKIYVLDTTVDTLCHGANLSIPGISSLESEIKPDDLTAILTLKNELIAIGSSLLTSEEIMKNERGLAVKISKVFMQPDIYPKFSLKSNKANY